MIKWVKQSPIQLKCKKVVTVEKALKLELYLVSLGKVEVNDGSVVAFENLVFDLRSLLQKGNN